MKVKTLIKKLSKFNPEMKVIVFNGEFNNPIKKIEMTDFIIVDGEYYEDTKGKVKAIWLY